MQKKMIIAFGSLMSIGLCLVGSIATGGVIFFVATAGQSTSMTIAARPTVARLTATATPTPRPSATVTATPLPPTATLTPIPTDTLTPTPSPTATVTTTNTPIPTQTPTETSIPLPTATPLPTSTATPEPTATPNFEFVIKESLNFPTNHPDFDIYIAITDRDNKPLGGYHVLGTHSSGTQVDSAVSMPEWTENSGAMWYKGANLKYHVANSTSGTWTMQLLNGDNQPVAEPVVLNFDTNNLTWFFLLYRKLN